ncbi:MAG: T9SS type A sorting domain-containing protein, partial [Marinoscillum sp.]
FDITLTVTSSVGCSSVIVREDFVIVSEEPGREDSVLILNNGKGIAEELEEYSNIVIGYGPNPIDNQKLKIDLTSNDHDEIRAYSISLDGRKLYLGDLILKRGFNEISLDVSEVKQGMHFISLEGEKTTHRLKIIKR